jgi:hypothetical protein
MAGEQAKGSFRVVSGRVVPSEDVVGGTERDVGIGRSGRAGLSAGFDGGSEGGELVECPERHGGVPIPSVPGDGVLEVGASSCCVPVVERDLAAEECSP